MNREQFAERLHNKITTLKGELLNLATETTSHVDLEMRHVDEVLLSCNGVQPEAVEVCFYGLFCHGK